MCPAVSQLSESMFFSYSRISRKELLGPRTGGAGQGIGVGNNVSNGSPAAERKPGGEAKPVRNHLGHRNITFTF